MSLKLALRNIVGNGWRSLINIGMIAVVLIGMVFMETMYHSWLLQAKTQQRDWEYAGGMLRVKSYDPFDAFSWEGSHAPLPAAAQELVEQGRAVPVLFTPGVIYPHGSMVSAMIKGIPRGQTLLKYPSALLAESSSGYAPAIIGRNMAKSSRLNQGDVVTLRVKDAAGAFNTLDLEIVKVIDCPVPSLDIGTVWMELETLRELRQLPGEATTLVSFDPLLPRLASKDFIHLTPKELFKDFDELMKTENMSKYMIYGLLMFLTGLALFDTQALALFKRRKEIGTLSALGMTKGQIIRLFTTEGILYYLFGVLAACVLGLALFWILGTKGWNLPNSYDEFGMSGFTEAIVFSYPPGLILSVLLWVFVIMAFVSWLPARKIASLKPTDALRGKVG